MTLENSDQLKNAKKKLADLEQLFGKCQESLTEGGHARELTLRSLKNRIFKFKQEIAEFESRDFPPA